MVHLESLLMVLLLCRLAISQCYTDINCTGTIIAAVVSGRDCCVEKANGVSFRISKGSSCTTCIVHGFNQAVYEVRENATRSGLNIKFQLNVKGGPSSAFVEGKIQAQPGDTTDSYDFEEIQEIAVHNNVDFRFFPVDDAITLEYDDTVILTFTPDDPSLISRLETAGEYIRDTATVNIIDNDQLEIRFEGCDYSVIEGSNLTAPIRMFYDGVTQNSFSLILSTVSISDAESENLILKSASIDSAYRATPGDDFTNSQETISVNKSETLGIKILELPKFFQAIDDDIHELEQNFALVAEIGEDTYKDYICFKTQTGRCLQRKGATNIRIIDNDPMVIGFTKRNQTVSEPFDEDLIQLAINVGSMRSSEKEFTMVFEYQESSSTAVVRASSTNNVDALFGNEENGFIKETRILPKGQPRNISLLTSIRHDFIPEDQECYTISLITMPIALCNNDGTNFFCHYTICINDENHPLVIAFEELEYTVPESVSEVEVCVRLVQPDISILTETVSVNIYKQTEPYLNISSSQLSGFLDECSTTNHSEHRLSTNPIANLKITQQNRIACYNYIVNNDMSLEEVEYVVLTLSVHQASFCTVVQQNLSHTTISILDDDFAVVELQTEAKNLTVTASGEVCAVVKYPKIACPVKFPFNVQLNVTTVTVKSSDVLQDYQSEILDLTFQACVVQNCVNISTVMNGKAVIFNLSLERPPDLDKRIKLGPLESHISSTYILSVPSELQFPPTSYLNHRSYTSVTPVNSPTFSPSPVGSAPSLLYALILVPVALLASITIIPMLIVISYRRRKNKEINNIISLPAIECSHESTLVCNIGEQSQRDQIYHQIQEKVPSYMVFSKDTIHLSKVVGQGESGVVYRAILDTIDGKELVAIKTVKALFAGSDVNRLTKEIKVMVSFNHPNVMTLRGVCLDQENPLLIMPFMSNGSVLEYVKHHRDDLMLTEEADNIQIKSVRKKMMGICLQVAKGMKYLAQLNLVHRDVAARNCMIDINGIIKVTDFGLTEDMYASKYFRKDLSDGGNDEKVPLRWMAPESIDGDIYTEKTDVWSFGVTCWEVFTCGQVPYRGIPVMRLFNTLNSGERLDKPNNSACSDEIFNMMHTCWNTLSEQRPTFSTIVQQISTVLEKEAGYVNLSCSDEFVVEY